MGELSIEEKAKAYDEAIKRAKAMIKVADNQDEYIGFANTIFPELKESEDEKIRKELIEHCRNTRCVTEKGAERIAKWLAWLEKQGEQNPYSGASFKYNGHTFGMCARDGGAEILIDGNLKAFISLDKSFIYPVIPIPSFKAENFYVSKVDGLIHDSTYNSTEKHEPKFHNGDWVTDGYLHCKISDVLDDRYIVDTKFAKRSAITFKRENNYHLWTIQDAKDGDMLTYGDNPNDNHVEVIMIFKSIRDEKSAFTHFHIFNGNFRVNNWCDCGKNVHPATKEQRDILFAKMKEAGYEWDADKKELKIIDWSKHIKYEPNGPSIIEENTEWSEEDVRNIENIDAVLFYDKDLPEDTCMRLRNWLKSLKNRIGG